MEDPLWGPVDPSPPALGHPIANAVCAGRARGAEVRFAGGGIDALVLCEGSVLRTAEPDSTLFGVAQVRRLVFADPLRLAHVVFAPAVPRPLLLGVVRLENRVGRAVKLDYSELWALEGTDYAAAPGACSCETPEGTRALADAASVVRARPPEAAPQQGLALDLPFLLPPHARRHLCFVYAAPQPGEPPALLVRAWRGDVLGELGRTVTTWLEHLGAESDPVAAYREQVARGAG